MAPKKLMKSPQKYKIHPTFSLQKLGKVERLKD
jgi:hypothetical protein